MQRDDVGRGGDLERLFQSWRELNALQARKNAQKEPLAPGETAPGAVIDPWVLQDTAKRLPAANVRELLFKLAFWRWTRPDLGPAFDELNDGDAIVYSVFRDLAALADEDSAMTEFDRKTNFMRGSGNNIP